MTRVRLLFILLPLGAPLVTAQEKKDVGKEAPRVTLIVPLGVSAGATATVRVRGLKLADATEVQFPDAKGPVTAAIKSKGKADLPQGLDAADVGDTQVEVELTVPAGVPAGPLALVVVTPQGATAPHPILVNDPSSTVEEKEPNNGFRQPQPLSPPTTVRGRIESAEDVDVFSFDVRAGQTLVAEVAAARYGSALDGLLTLYDARGNVLETADDAPADKSADASAAADSDDQSRKDPAQAAAARARRDPVLRFRCPADGTCYLALSDANGKGGPAHAYQLTVKFAD